MKRSAEKQISKDDRSDDESEQNEQTGFRKADERVLAGRQIRGLPKRALGVAHTAPPINPPAPAPPTRTFNGFSGFVSTPNPFLPQSSSTTTTTTTTSTVPTTTTFAPKPAANLFAAPPPSSTSLPSPAPITQPPKPSIPDSTPDTHKADVEYFSKLRGLNESLRRALEKELEQDPFIDISPLFQTYKTHRDTIEKEKEKEKTSVPNGTSKETNKGTLAMPAPPSSVFKFSSSSSATSSRDNKFTSSGGFKPSVAVPSTGFSFGSSSTPSKPDTEKSTGTSLFGGTKSPETKETSKDSESTKDEAPKSFFNTTSSSPFVFGGSSSSTSSFKPDSFSGFGKTDTNTSPASAFSSSSSAFKFASGDSNKDKPKASPFSAPTSTFSFGGATNATTTSNSDNPPSRFAGFPGFGKTSTPSVGFGFGSPSFGTTSTPASMTNALTTATTTTTGGTNGNGNGEGEGNSDDVPKKNAAESFALNADNKHDQEGAGEEDEDSIHAVKLKAYVMKDAKDGKGWVELGFGVLRIKKHKETGSRRILLRSSSTGQILINFAFHSALKPVLKNKNITFLGHDASHTSKMYTIKLPTDDQAIELNDVLEREIKAKNES